METRKKILGLAAITLGLFVLSGCISYKEKCPATMEELSITKHGIVAISGTRTFADKIILKKKRNKP